MKIILQASNIIKTYDENIVINNFSYSFYKGKIYGLIGENGVGKTTLLKSLGGYIPIDEGIINNHSQRISYISDELLLPEFLTGQEFLSLIKKSWNSELDYRDIALQMNFHEYLEDHIMKYSKGTKQKLRLLAGLISNPDVILLDEPLTGVDSSTSKVISSIFKNLLLNDVTIIYTSHFIDSLNYFENIEILNLNILGGVSNG